MTATPINPVVAFSPGYSFLNIAGATTTLVKTGGGKLIRILINKAVASGVITVYDALTATSTKMCTITQPGTLLQTNYFMDFDLAFSVGLTVVTSAADDITVIYD